MPAIRRGIWFKLVVEQKKAEQIDTPDTSTPSSSPLSKYRESR